MLRKLTSVMGAGYSVVQCNTLSLARGVPACSNTPMAASISPSVAVFPELAPFSSPRKLFRLVENGRWRIIEKLISKEVARARGLIILRDS